MATTTLLQVFLFVEYTIAKLYPIHRKRKPKKTLFRLFANNTQNTQLYISLFEFFKNAPVPPSSPWRDSQWKNSVENCPLPRTHTPARASS